MEARAPYLVMMEKPGALEGRRALFAALYIVEAHWRCGLLYAVRPVGRCLILCELSLEGGFAVFVTRDPLGLAVGSQLLNRLVAGRNLARVYGR